MSKRGVRGHECESKASETERENLSNPWKEREREREMEKIVFVIERATLG